MSAAFTSVGLEDEVVAIVRSEIAICLEPIYGENLKMSVQEWRCDWQIVSEGRSKEIWLPGAGDVFGSFGPANPASDEVRMDFHSVASKLSEKYTPVGKGALHILVAFPWQNHI